MDNRQFLKIVLSEQMPMEKEVMDKCLNDRNVRWYKKKRIQKTGIAVACMFIALILAFSPIRTLAGSFINNFFVTLKINDKKVDLGEDKSYMITIPKDCENVEYEGDQYLTKQYNSVKELESEINQRILKWEDTDKESDVLLAIKNDEYARASVIYKLFDDATVPDDYKAGDVIGISMQAYIPLKDGVSIADCELKDSQLEYVTLDEDGTIKEFQQNEKYELFEQYFDDELKTDVTIVSDKNEVETSTNDNFGKTERYYFYFLNDGIFYQIEIEASLRNAKQLIKEFVKENDQSLSSYESNEVGNSDLVFREIVGESLSLNKGDKIEIRSQTPFNNVYIQSIGDERYEIGDLRKNETVEIVIESDGEYAIYSENESAQNITKNVSISIERTVDGVSGINKL